MKTPNCLQENSRKAFCVPVGLFQNKVKQRKKIKDVKEEKVISTNTHELKEELGNRQCS